MIGRSNAVSGGNNKYEFIYDYDTPNGMETLNGNPISIGDQVALEAGSLNVLYAPAEAGSIITEDGQYIPTRISNSPITRAPSMAQYIQFVMPSQNCSYVFN